MILLYLLAEQPGRQVQGCRTKALARYAQPVCVDVRSTPTDQTKGDLELQVNGMMTKGGFARYPDWCGRDSILSTDYVVSFEPDEPVYRM